MQTEFGKRRSSLETRDVKILRTLRMVFVLILIDTEMGLVLMKKKKQFVNFLIPMSKFISENWKVKVRILQSVYL